ncbi:MAG: permease [Atribacterota bacterium]|nr:permease [Atribacterota bacterium]MDD4896907.1 permease [Atribacterota bacterium]MDD5637726.1 permease [Atribacterota bacterium]
MKEQNKKEKNKIKGNLFFITILAYFIYIIYSYVFNISSGIEIGTNLISFLSSMSRILPCAFILIGLFEVWVPRERVEKHLGYQGGFQGYIWAIILAGTMAGGLLVALPVSSALYRKGARLSVIFTFLGASAVVRIPMTLFEASFLGAEFTVIRWTVSIPLIIISSLLLEKYLSKEQFDVK